MFAKLLKNEWRSSAGTLGLLSLIALSLGVAGGLALRLVIELETRQQSVYNPMLGLVITLLTMFLFLVAVALGVYVCAVYILLMYRFYKNKFTDEGYLTFTLPVTNHQIFLSSLVNVLIWTLISGVVVLADFVLALILGFGPKELISDEVLWMLERALEEIFAVFLDTSPGTVVITVLTVLVSAVASPVIAMACLTVGATVAKKHKILASIGIIYGVNSVSSMISGVFMMLPALFVPVVMESDIIDLINAMLLPQLIMPLVLGIGGYFLATYLMKHKLNLP